MRGCVMFILMLFGVAVGSAQLIPTPSAVPPEQIVSASGHYTATIERCCADYSYIAAFDVTDNQTGITSHQNLKDVPNLDLLAGGISFAWTPNEHYLVLETDNRVTSHGCDELLVYTGDGSQRVYTTLGISICRLIQADGGITVLDFCANDDLILSSGHRVHLPAGVETHTGETSCG